MNTKRKGKIIDGDVEISDDELAPSAVRRRISIMVPEDVLARLKSMADERGIGYQTLANEILRSSTDEKNSVSVRLDRIERALVTVKGFRIELGEAKSAMPREKGGSPKRTKTAARSSGAREG